ncbi:unnamed protein product [Symbiodinium sp. CCMP2592]|nr:unnamed protein product [Symbiodinium sp. CCMP2592]
MAGELHASAQTQESIFSASYWRQLCPELHVEDKSFQAEVLARDGRSVAAVSDCREVRARILEEGFAALSPAQLSWTAPVGRLAQGVLQLEQHGWPATFIALYDEAWAMARDAGAVMREATGNSLCMDVVGFLVRPSQTKGFSPHRDRQPEDWTPKGVPPETSATFKADGMAKYVTLWAALTDATPENSCLHFVPRSSDPGYSAGDPDDGDPMLRIFQDKAAFQSIRSAPVAAGGCTFHTHRTIHWGSKGRRHGATEPRIALSFGFSTEDFEPPYFSPKALPFPELRLRAALASAQVLNYATLAVGDREGWSALAGEMAGCGTATLRLLHRVFQSQVKRFHPTYRKEIATKFVSVSLNLQPEGQAQDAPTKHANEEAAAPQDKGPRQPKRQRAIAEVDSDDDDALMAMLEAEASTGEVLFHDDFDLLNAAEGGSAAAHATPKVTRKKKALGKKKSRRLQLWSYDVLGLQKLRAAAKL